MAVQLFLVSAESGHLLGTLRGRTRGVTSVAISDDGEIIMSRSFVKTVRRWNTSTKTQIGDPLLGHGAQVKGVAISSNGKLIISASEGKSVRLWDAKTGAQIGFPLQEKYCIFSIAISSDSSSIVAGLHNGKFQVWPARTK